MTTAFEQCPFCPIVFEGRDAPRTADENAVILLNRHIPFAHSERTMKCPRRDEAFSAVSAYPKEDFWRADDTCSYCGSMSATEFFAAIAAHREIGPTDKGYKVYVTVPNPVAGQIVRTGSESGPAFGLDGRPNRDNLTEAEIAAGRYNRVFMGAAPATISKKFYFQHLSDAEQSQFIDLMNAKSVKIGFPGHFYVLPFFVKREPQKTG